MRGQRLQATTAGATESWARKIGVAGIGLLLILGICSMALADEGASNPANTTVAADTAAGDLKREPTATEPDARITEARVAANNAWILTSSALVLLMTAPGLAMFYGGLVRKKNVLSVIMQCMFLMGMSSVVWAVWGYSLSFGGDGGTDALWVGTPEFMCMKGVTPEWDEANHAPKPTPMLSDAAGRPLIPLITHMLFQGMFFIITPALICGAFAERMKFSAMVAFTLLWGTLVYCPLCHWVWDNGLLAYNSPKALGGGALDFAGGTVVHISSGVSALVCALLMGRRLGFGNEPMPPHNLTYTALGAALLWFGWFGFNGGSALAADAIAASAFAATHFAAAAGLLGWAGIEWFRHGKPTVLGACSGAVAGLVCITPASGYVAPMWAIVMGLAAGVLCYFTCSSVKARFKYDDSLDAFGVHGVGGTLGAILTGVFASRAVNNVGSGKPLGMLEGGELLKGQLVATLVTWVFAAVVTFIILKALDGIIGLRVATKDEIEGLDYSQHGEEGYIFL